MKSYDSLYGIIPPHITLAFPFKDDISNEDLVLKLSDILKNVNPFFVNFKGISFSDDDYIFLNCIKGNDELVFLHDNIYKYILPNHKSNKYTYVPHITLGKSTDHNLFVDFNYEFTCLIDEVSVELIGENEESIILSRLFL